jgi:hypothetical protein
MARNCLDGIHVDTVNGHLRKKQHYNGFYLREEKREENAVSGRKKRKSFIFTTGNNRQAHTK